MLGPSDASSAETELEMVKSRPEKLDALIKAWLDEAVRDEVIPGDDRRRAEIMGNIGIARAAKLEIAAAREMAAD